MSIALVTYSDAPKLTASDQLLVDPLKRTGFPVEAVPWDLPGVEWSNYNLVILRSCWNYHLHLSKFLAWLTELKHTNVTVWNPVDVILWNSNKTYLKDLSKKDIPTIPTLWMERNQQLDLAKILQKSGWNQIVVKPAVGASAYKVESFEKSNFLLAEQQIREVSKNVTVMVQPLMEEIYDGELSIVFIGGMYSHTVLKKPRTNEFRSNAKFQELKKIIELDENLLFQAENIYQRLALKLLYARIDAIIVERKLVVMELELIEPNLFFDLYPFAAEKFATIVRKRAI